MSNNLQNQNANVGLPIFGFMVLLLIAGWWIYHDPLVTGVLSIYRYVFVAADALFGWRSSYASDHILLVDQVLAQPRILGFKGMIQIMSHGGEYLRWLVVPPLFYLAWVIYKNPVRLYNEKMTVQRFLQRQSVTWKPIVPVLHLDLVKNNPKGWRDPYTAPEIARKAKLLIARKLNSERVKLYLESQLGPKIDVDNLDAMRPYEKALFAVFALRIVREKTPDKKTIIAQRLLDDLNESSRGTGMPNFELAKSAFDRLKADKKVLKSIAPHAYVRTALVQMLCDARVFDGVLPPSQFIWLRPMDQSLFYALNRAPVVPERLHTASFAEASCILGQWQAERVAFMNQHKLTAPYIDGAASAIAEDLIACGVIDPAPKQDAELSRNRPRPGARAVNS